MRDIYQKLGWLKPIIGESNKYSDTPEGELDVDRLISGKPAFLALADSQSYKPKKLLINTLEIPQFASEFETKKWQLQVLFSLRQALNDGFEIYEYDNDELNSLSNYSLSCIDFTTDKKVQSDSDLHSRLARNLSTSYDDIAVITAQEISELIKEMPDEARVLWQSDCRDLNIESREIIKFVQELHIQSAVDNILDETDDNLSQYSELKTTVRVNIAVYSKVSDDTDLQHVKLFTVDESVTSEVDITEMLNRIPALEILVLLGQCQITPSQLVCPQLRQIFISDREISSNFLIEFIKAAPKLKKIISTQQIIDLADDELEYHELAVILPNLLKLEELSIKVNDDFLALVEEGKLAFKDSKFTLNVVDVSLSATDLYLLLDRFWKLEKINFAQTELDLSGIFFYGIQLFILARSLSNIKKINLGDTNLSASEIAHLIESAHNLETISYNLDSIILDGSISLTKKQLNIILFGANNPTKLFVSFSDNFFEVLQESYKSFDSIEELQINNFNNHDRQDLNSFQINLINKKFPNLKSIKLPLEPDVILSYKKNFEVVFSKLENIIIDNYIYNFQDLKLIPQLAPFLKTISVNIDGDYTDLIMFLNLYPQLDEIKIDCERIILYPDEIDHFLTDRRVKLNGINYIDCSNCDLLDEHILKIYNSYPGVQEIKCKDGLICLRDITCKSDFIHKYRGLKKTNHDVVNIEAVENSIVSSKYTNPFSVQAIDANTSNTEDKKTIFNLTRVFYEVGVSENHPHPRGYRHKCFAGLQVNPNPCNENEVFSICNHEDLKLTDCSSLVISEQDVYQLTLKQNSNVNNKFFYAKTKVVLNQMWQALPSLDSNEKITHIHFESHDDIEIKYSQRDNLYYIRRMYPGPEIETTVDYLLEFPEREQKPSIVIQKLIDFCSEFKAKALEMSKYSNPTGVDYLIELVQQRVGACRHRAVVFKALLENNRLRETIPELKGLDLSHIHARIIMNECHAFVEIEDSGHWVKYDLGGYDVEAININEDNAPVLGTEIVENKSESTQELPKQRSQIIDLIHESPVRQYFSTPTIKTAANVEVYIQQLICAEEPKRLIECNPEQLDGLNYYLQEYCTKVKHSYFYVNSADDLIMRKSYVEIQDDNIGVIKKGLTGPLYRFLSETSKSKTLIINLANFTPNELARFNSVLDETPSIDGINLQQNIKVIGLISSIVEKDASLYSRFGQAVEECPVQDKDFNVPQLFQITDSKNDDHESLEIDLYGSINWQSILLGNWHLKADKLMFVPGLLVSKLQEKVIFKKLVIKNPPVNNYEFVRFFQHANLNGFIEYEGRKLEWPRVILETNYDYIFNSGQIVSVEYRQPDKKYKIINPAVFGSYLKKYFFQEVFCGRGQFHEIEGIIESSKDQILYIAVSESLLPNQWSQLLAECRKHNVKLDIRLAQNVNLPFLWPKLEGYYIEKDLDVVSSNELTSKSKADCCFITGDRDLFLANWQVTLTNTICIDVSELASSDLLTKVTGKLNEEMMCLDFTQESGALITALEQSKTVILHGDFSDELRQMLQNFMFERNKQTNCKGQLVIVSDEKTANYFSFLPVPIFKHEYPSLENQQVKQSDSKYDWEKQQEYFEFNFLNAKAQAEKFDNYRLESVQTVLAKSPFVFLAGMTGVGKTSFVEKVWQNKKEGRTLYIGEIQLQSWANDRSPGIKALFIDEANITSKNWSQFEGLFHNIPPGIMIGNRYVELTNDHKVIFAGNPVTYSDDRTLPSLFERHNKSVVFEPFSSAYIYHQLLSPLFSGENKTLAEKICLPILLIYKNLNSLSKDSVLLTPRELVMMAQISLDFCIKNSDSNPELVSKYFAFQLARHFVPKYALKKFDANFSVARPISRPFKLLVDNGLVFTASNQKSAQILMDFLELRNTYAYNTTNLPAAGLGGIIFEGEPGLGKSELAIACLLSHGLTKRSIDAESNTSGGKNYFYHLPAGANTKVKKELLIRAFNEGAIVLCDEINTASSLESLLNRLLMGKGPNGEEPRNPGFMLIATQNPNTMAGRAKTSTALLHRMHREIIPHYTESEMKAILSKIGLPNRHVEAIVNQYLKAKENNTSLCFRDLIFTAKQELHSILSIKPKVTGGLYFTDVPISEDTVKNTSKVDVDLTLGHVKNVQSTTKLRF